jgi:hypothetical protein
VRPLVLAAALGHLGRVEEARAAFDQYQAISLEPAETFVRRQFSRHHRKRWLDGIALAQGEAPLPDVPGPKS